MMREQPCGHLVGHTKSQKRGWGNCQGYTMIVSQTDEMKKSKSGKLKHLQVDRETTPEENREEHSRPRKEYKGPEMEQA